jgi:glutathione peroxidase
MPLRYSHAVANGHDDAMDTRHLLAIGLTVIACHAAAADADAAATPTTPLAFTLATADGGELRLADLKGKVILLVNTASRCGYTRQYAGLQKLYADHQAQGLVVLAVPSNDFGAQEPGTNEQIRAFCTTTYAVTFPVVAKVPVSGAQQVPLYRWLTIHGPFPGPIGWNFTKFLIGRDGTVVGRWPSKVAPDDAALTAAVREALAKP